jgi:hypothetical protein
MKFLLFILLLATSCQQTLIDEIAAKKNSNIIYPVVILEETYNGQFYQYRVEDCAHNTYYIGKVNDEYNVGQTINKP